MSRLYRLCRAPAASAIFWTISAAVILPSTATGAPLTLAEAEQIALETDPVVGQLQAQSVALSERAIAEGQLSDPELSIGIAEVPLDNFSLGEHEDTEVRIVLSQAFPPGHTRQFRTQRMNAMASAEQSRAQNQRLLVQLGVRTAYVDLYYQREVRRVLELNHELFHEMVDIATRQYAAGSGSQHDVLRAQLELSLISDRIEETSGTLDVARTELTKWITEVYAGRPLPNDEPDLPVSPSLEEILARLPQHPLLAAEDARIEAAQKSVAIAQEQYKPQWMLDFMLSENTGGAYSQRSGPDFAGVFLTMSLPIFTSKRQDRELAASRQETTAARYGRSDQLRELTRMAEGEYANLNRLDRRLELYRERATVEAEQTREAALNAYQNDLVDFETLARARSLALETELEVLRLRANRLKSRIGLLYLAGEPS